MITRSRSLHVTVFVTLIHVAVCSRLSAQNVPTSGSTPPAATPVAVPTAYTTTSGNYVRTYDVNMITTDPAAVIAAT
ncbi:MAG TPA: hypothetical protein VGC22_11935, partial [Chitinophaga sp.]